MIVAVSLLLSIAALFVSLLAAAVVGNMKRESSEKIDADSVVEFIKGHLRKSDKSIPRWKN